MGTESIEASFLSIFALISFFVFLITSKYSYKIKNGALFDKDFVRKRFKTNIVKVQFVFR